MPFWGSGGSDPGDAAFPLDLVRPARNVLNWEGDAEFDDGPGGRGLHIQNATSGSSQSPMSCTLEDIVFAPPFTWVCHFSTPDGASSGGDVAVLNDFSSTQNYLGRLFIGGTGTVRFQQRNGAAFNTADSTTTINDGKPHVIGGLHNGSADQRVYVDGYEEDQETGETTTQPTGPIDRFTFGTLARTSQADNASPLVDGTIYLFAVYDRRISDDEWVAYQEDPYAVIRPSMPFLPAHLFTDAGQSVNLGLASETDTALSITPTPGAASVAIGIATETDTALSITPSTGTQSVNLGIATETDTALSITPTPGAASVAIGQATETDAALSITASGSATVNLGLASETDTALSITPTPGAASVNLGLATETDQALPITVSLRAPEIFRVLDVKSNVRILDVKSNVRILDN